MDTVQLALLALLLGALVGAAVTVVIVLALRARDRGRAQDGAGLPDGVASVLAALDEPVAVVDASFIVVAASGPAAGVGIVRGEVLDGAELRALVRQAREAGAPSAAILRIVRPGPGRDERLLSARASMMGSRLALLVARDMTEHERLEQMRQDFVANTSHELKTPVGAVRLLAEAVESAADDPDQVRAFALRLQAEATRLANLTARIMNLSRLQAADELSVVADVSVDEIITAAVAAHAVQADSAGVGLIRGGDSGLSVRGDAQILVEALGNLIANAIVYSPSGSHVGVGAKVDGGMVEISVTDQGIGISEEEQQRIFERFYRADQARSRRTGGSGLGLAIVKHAVQRHGGEVRMWSRPGRGSTFMIRLARVDAGDAGHGRRKAGKSKSPKSPKSPKPSKSPKAGKTAEAAKGERP
ncbi:sensor histidine kinase [Microbacterium sp.]|uniref:sensor histidine kinase n=1 Tax=Microbacterium sp. TaxID=51671 RepID=UPI0037CAFCD9